MLDGVGSGGGGWLSGRSTSTGLPNWVCNHSSCSGEKGGGSLWDSAVAGSITGIRQSLVKILPTLENLVHTQQLLKALETLNTLPTLRL